MLMYDFEVCFYTIFPYDWWHMFLFTPSLFFISLYCSFAIVLVICKHFKIGSFFTRYIWTIWLLYIHLIFSVTHKSMDYRMKSSGMFYCKRVLEILNKILKTLVMNMSLEYSSLNNIFRWFWSVFGFS